MRVVVDGGSWANRRGFGRFTRELVGALARFGRHEYTLVLDAAAARLASTEGVTVVPVALTAPPSEAASAEGWRSPWDLLRMGRALARERGDVIFFPCVYTYVPLMTRRPIVTGVHDTIAERYPDLIFPGARARLFWQLKMRAALRQSTCILTVSEHARQGVQEQFAVPPARLRWIDEAPAAAFQPVDDPEAVRRAFVRHGLPPAARVVIYVGGLAPHKNLTRVVRAFASLVDQGGYADARLLLVGNHATDVFHSAEKELRALAAECCHGQVIFASGVPDEDLVLLLNGACALVLASLDEGFGLPGVEAAACGTPVIATRASAMPAVLGDAPLYVDPLSESSIAAALHQAFTDPGLRADRGARGAERARALSWRRSAERLESVFDEVAAQAGRP